MGVSEKEFESRLVDLEAQCGWSRWHVADARKIVRTRDGLKTVPDPGVAGLPDEILVHPLHGFVFAELKRQAKAAKARPKQRETLLKMSMAARQAGLTGCKVRVHLWRPDDWDAIIVPLLQRGEGPIVYGLDDLRP